MSRVAGAALVLLLTGGASGSPDARGSASASVANGVPAPGPNSSESATALGQIQAFVVAGEVELIAKDGTQHRLVRGETFTEGNLVRDGKDGWALLVLSNGTVVKLHPYCQLDVTLFRQEPFDEKVGGAYLRLGKEPSTSTTILYLRNEMAQIEVKPLNAAGGSSFEVDTPVGDFGLREGILAVKVGRNPGGQLRQVVADCLGGGVTYTPVAPIFDDRGRLGYNEAFFTTFDLRPAQQLQVAVQWDPVTSQVSGGRVGGAVMPLDAANVELEMFYDTVNAANAIRSRLTPLPTITVAPPAPAGIPTVPYEPIAPDFR